MSSNHTLSNNNNYYLEYLWNIVFINLKRFIFAASSFSLFKVTHMAVICVDGI